MAAAPVFEYRGTPQRLSLANPQDAGVFVDYGSEPDVGANEEVLVMASHTLTHMDALTHVFAEGVMYNGLPTDAVSTLSRVPNCGIDKVRGVVGRAVHLDMARHMGVDWLEPGSALTGDDLEACARAEEVEVRSGDILLVRTGYLEYWHSLGDPTDPTLAAGLGLGTVDFIRDNEISVVGCDNSRIEPVPFERNIFLGLHIELLVKLGVHLLEHVNLVGLHTDRVTECLFVVAPLPVPGASGSPINPIAIG